VHLHHFRKGCFWEHRRWNW